MEYFLPEEIIEEIRERFNLVDVVSDYTRLKKSGRNYMGLCPFHSEKTPSFTVSLEKQLYYCFGCGAGGNIFTFIMSMENYTFMEAVRSLAERAGVSLPERNLSREEKRAKLINEELLKINEISMKYFQKVLFKTDPGKRALKYLKKRGLQEQAIKKFYIGFSPPDWNSLKNFLKNKGFSESNIEKAGIIVLRSDKSGYYDRFRNRIMFPIFSQHNQVIGFGGRVLDDSQPKYMNSPETPVYNKSKSLYALNFARFSMREKNQLIIFEGYLDVITAFQNGLENCVASLGTSLTGEQAKIIRRNASSVIIAYDSDTAGESATWRGLDTLSDAGCQVKVAQLPEGQDPDEFIRKKGITVFNTEIIQKALPLVDYKLEKIHKGTGSSNFDTPEKKLSYLNRVLPVLSDIKNSVELDLYIQKVSSQIGVNPNTVKNELKKYRQNKRRKGRELAPKDVSAFSEKLKPPAAEKKILNVMLKSKESIGEVKKHLDVSDFKYEPYRLIVEKLYVLIDNNSDYSIEAFLDLFTDSEIKKMIVSLTMEDDIDLENSKKVIRDCVKKIKSYQLSLKRKEIEGKIQKLDKERDAGEIKKLLEKWSELKRLEKDIVPYRREY